MSPLDARSFGKHADGRSSAGGRPAHAIRKQRIAVYLTPDLISAYEQEAERRWPGSVHRRGQVIEEALLSWMLADRLKEGRQYEQESCRGPRRFSPPAPAAPDARSADSE